MRSRTFKNMEWMILISALLLSIVGFIALYSATQSSGFDELKKQIDELKSVKSNLKPKEKQIRDSDIASIKELRTEGLSYREISQKTCWSKATVCRVLNGFYD